MCQRSGCKNEGHRSLEYCCSIDCREIYWLENENRHIKEQMRKLIDQMYSEMETKKKNAQKQVAYFEDRMDFIRGLQEKMREANLELFY